MLKFRKICLSLIAIFLTNPLIGIAFGKERESKMKSLSITIVYNNLHYDERLEAAWGFACFIKGLEKNILFDTGGSGPILLSNMKKLGVKPQEVDIIFLSHNHLDHTGGLWYLLKENHKVTVYLPESFPEDFKKRIKALGADYFSVNKPREIFKGVFTTGEMSRGIIEQSLILDTEKGLVVITGCAHPGIAVIVKKAKQMCEGQIYLALGGFHLMGYTEGGIKEIIHAFKEMGVAKVGPSHCTGEKALELFKKNWGDNFLGGGCGAIMEIK